MNEKKNARLENWYVGDNDILYGEVFGHVNFEDGTEIRTSRVVKFDPQSGKAVTLNTNYELGTPRRLDN